MRKVALLLLLPMVAFAAETQPAATAFLAGTIDTKATITRVAAVDREWADVLKTSVVDPKDAFLYEGSVDEKGHFEIKGLLAGRAYDLIVWTKGADGTAVRWEGANMDYHRAITPSMPATDADRKEIEGLITDPPQFYDKVRALKMAADHQHATVLVELTRTRDFHTDTGGEVIYRVELWYFENQFGGWAKDNNTEKVLVRARGKPGDLPGVWQFLPQLGGLTGKEQASGTLSTVVLPEVVTEKDGVVGGIK